MNKSKEGSLPIVIRQQENDAKTLADILDPFTDEFELPHKLFSDIMQSENRRIRIAEYAELSGYEGDIQKKKRVFESFLENHKKFVVLFANWPAAIAHGKLLDELEDDSILNPNTTEVKTAYSHEFNM